MSASTKSRSLTAKNMRVLNPNEIKQIAGRAGRFGLSEQGMVGALSKANLNVIRQAIEAENTSIGFAYVAPTPESLALLPGTLEDKLRTMDDAQWHSGTMAAAAQAGRPVRADDPGRDAEPGQCQAAG